MLTWCSWRLHGVFFSGNSLLITALDDVACRTRRDEKKTVIDFFIEKTLGNIQRFAKHDEFEEVNKENSVGRPKIN